MTTKTFPPQTVFDQIEQLKAELRKRDQLIENLHEELAFRERVAAKRLDQIHPLRQPRPEIAAAASLLRDALFDLGPTGQYRDMGGIDRAGHLQTAANLTLELLQEAGR
ncbi:hypothetical protein [Microbulbifer sp. ARAS458-1]|uniref:hypothetical protein n=1 Tax=Microbulbifer sp. ARAS458-1 TaxID=3140242 RepID=UPI003877D8A1